MSARKIIVLSVISTYCLTIIGIFACLFIGRISADVFLGVFAGLTGIAGIITERYFSRDDRKGDKK